MAQTTPKSVKQPPRDTRPDGFDVTSVIGRVVFDDDGAFSAHVNAFQIIAMHDTPGEYTFPMSNGQTCRVAVEYEGGPDARTQ